MGDMKTEFDKRLTATRWGGGGGGGGVVLVGVVVLWGMGAFSFPFYQ